MNDIELIPCPFCGAENTDVGFIGHTDDCYLILKYIGAAKKEQLIAAWNKRFDNPNARQEYLSQVDTREMVRNLEIAEIYQRNLRKELALARGEISHLKDYTGRGEGMSETQEPIWPRVARHQAEKYKQQIEQIVDNVNAFAGRLRAWGYDAAAKEMIDEAFGGMEEIAVLRAENERLNGALSRIANYRDFAAWSAKEMRDIATDTLAAHRGEKRQ